MVEFLKYPKIFHLGQEDSGLTIENPEDLVVVQEKIDGGNMRFFVREGRVIFGSHTQELAEVPDEFFKLGVEYIRQKLDEHKSFLDSLNGAFIFYGEYCVRHSIDYDWEKIPRFLGFDILDINTNQFLDWKKAKEIYENLGITFVPVIKECKVSELGEISEAMIPKSAYSAGPAEGIIIKNYQRQKMTKIVGSHFKEVNKEVFGLSGRQARATNDPAEIVVATYCTNARIDKMIFKLMEQNEKLGLEMMHKLPRAVTEDMWEENWREIVTSNLTLDLRLIRGMIAKRCLAVLKQVMINNALQHSKKSFASA
jgi:ATP-dependent RNA circularization protein (DNA/RNA ligase family)